MTLDIPHSWDHPWKSQSPDYTRWHWTAFAFFEMFDKSFWFKLFPITFFKTFYALPQEFLWNKFRKVSTKCQNISRTCNGCLTLLFLQGCFELIEIIVLICQKCKTPSQINPECVPFVYGFFIVLKGGNVSLKNQLY